MTNQTQFFADFHANYGIPSGATRFKSEKAKVYGYAYTASSGHPATIIFPFGAKKKPSVYTRFHTQEQRTRYVSNYINNLIAREERKAKNRAEANQPATLKVNDILYTSWGYDQTNVDFYKVLELIGKRKVRLVKIRADQKIDGHGNGMSGQVFPEVLDEVGKPFERMVTNGETVKIHSCAWAKKWDGRALYNSWYA